MWLEFDLGWQFSLWHVDQQCMCIDMCTNMCIDMCIDMCVDMCIDMCTDMCVDMCTGMWISGAYTFSVHSHAAMTAVAAQSLHSRCTVNACLANQ